MRRLTKFLTDIFIALLRSIIPALLNSLQLVYAHIDSRPVQTFLIDLRMDWHSGLYNARLFRGSAEADQAKITSQGNTTILYMMSFYSKTKIPK